MELRVLQYFLTVVQEENISRAAEVLHVTQPTLSRQMAQLEEELRVQLFVRGRHLTLTDAGVMLRRRAEEVTALMEKMQQELEGHCTGGSDPAPPHHLRPPLHPTGIGDLAWHGVFPAESLCHL